MRDTAGDYQAHITYERFARRRAPLARLPEKVFASIRHAMEGRDPKPGPSPAARLESSIDLSKAF